MDTLPELLAWRDGKKVNEDGGTFKKEEDDEEDLFKDVDPKTLAAVLLESLNHSQLAIRRDGEEQKDNVKVEAVQGDKGHVNQEVPMMERADRDRQLELELLLAAQGKERDREKEDELKKAQEEEEKVTEKVTSRTISQDIHVQVEQLPKGLEEGEDNQQSVSLQEGPGSNEEEEQLNPEELKSLETMMQVFPRLNTVAKREESSEQYERDSRDYSSYNDIIPLNKGNNLAMTKKKLKWQEETQKALNFPMFETNLMDELESDNYADSKTEQAQSSVKQELLADDEPEDGNDEDEDALSPEEEEVRAEAEQEEIRRQAAEAQRAKLEEEKLADIASDMLLRYMGKQGNGNKKHSSNAVEDKRSDEEQTEENDIDPQTIDKLIEISSKLHLPADDVVDIISDVEKKKKKDMPSGMMFHQQQDLNPSFSSKHVFSATPILTEQNRSPISNLPSPAFGQLKTWFRDKPLSKSPDLWGNLPKPLPANRNQPKPSNPLKQELWIKSLKPSYPFYPYTYYQRNRYPVYPYYFPSPLRFKPRFYIPKSSQSGNNFDENSRDESYYFPKNHFYSWVRTPPRNPTISFQRKPYFSHYPLRLYPWTIQSILRPRSPPRVPAMPPQQKKYYYSALAHPAMANEDYYVSVNQPNSRKIPVITQILGWKINRLQKQGNGKWWTKKSIFEVLLYWCLVLFCNCNKFLSPVLKFLDLDFSKEQFPNGLDNKDEEEFTTSGLLKRMGIGLIEPKANFYHAKTFYLNDKQGDPCWDILQFY